MIGYHHSPKLFHILLRALLLGDFSQANFQHSAFSGSHHKILVGRGNRARPPFLSLAAKSAVAARRAANVEGRILFVFIE